eukprot:TRINITY_DN2653_c0_g1_i1.p1 TRINITY_DN2653_c0_g1~~TRINITY_DN2653_c0_g1_i1.p1  ORF type:complete len:681 (-),score=118.30 TRINITY_DN2653_c0_g1_i1:84-2084(-)
MGKQIILVLLLITFCSIHHCNEVFDWIVVGAGCSGATIARKLIDYFPHDKVLLLERGLDNLDPVFVDETCTPEPHIFNTTNPKTCTYPVLLSPRRFVGNPAVAYYLSTPQPQLPNNRSILFAAGNATGGGTSINSMIAFRALREEFEKFTSIPGLEEYGYHAIMAYYRKVERNENKKVFWDRNGDKGRIPVSNDQVGSIMNETALLQAAVANGFNPTDINAFQIGGLSKTMGTVTKNGRRASSAINYLDSVVRSNRKFTLRNGCRVRRILFKRICPTKTSAAGIEYIRDGVLYSVTATKEIILSAGAIETPRILKSSGIGPKDELQAVNIPVIMNLAQVGSNFQDKPLVFTNFRLRASDNPKMNTSIINANSTFQQWKYNGTGPLTGIAINWANHGGTANIDLEISEQGLLPDPYYTFNNWVRVICFNGLAKSRGSIKLNPSDIYGSPLIDAAILRDPSDADKLIECQFKGRKMLQDAGVIADDLLPSTAVWNNRTAFLEFIKSNVNPTYHNCGSCRMGTNSSVGVVNNRHEVFGVQKLRIMDYSIFPTFLRVNPQLTLYALSEKLADYIREDHQRNNPRKGAISLSFVCTPPDTSLNDYSIWRVTNRSPKAYVYHWSSSNGAKGSFSVEANSESLFFTPVDPTQTVTLRINDIIIDTKTSSDNQC